MSNEEILANKIEEYLESEQCKYETMYLSKDDLMLCMLALRLQVIDKTSVGVSDDVCEWKKSKDYPFDWFVGCDGCEVNHRQGDYCPRCGKKIKIVGD